MKGLTFIGFQPYPPEDIHKILWLYVRLWCKISVFYRISTNKSDGGRYIIQQNVNQCLQNN